MGKVINVPGRFHSTEQGNVIGGANEILDDTKGKKQNVINAETDAELQRLDESKQDNITIDVQPTEGSTNPVSSGGVYAKELTLQQAINAILVLIPSAATQLNKLADVDWVTSQITMNTATFRGTYNSLAELQAVSADNNDYGYVRSVDQAGNTIYSRYKYVDGTGWVFEYDINNTGFTADEWNAIRSGITAELVAKLSALPTAAQLITQFDAKQNVLTFDNVPTLGSDNPVKSGGVKTAIDTVQGNVDNVTALIPSEATTANQLADKEYVVATILAQVSPMLATALNAIYGGATGDYDTFGKVEQKIKDEVNRATARESYIENTMLIRLDQQDQAISTLNGNTVIPVANHSAVTNPEEGIIYRQQGTDSYTDWMYYDGQWMPLATYTFPGLDNEPTSGSDNIAKSGGTFDFVMRNAGAYDVSVNFPTGGTEGGNAYTLANAIAKVPANIQKGGIRIKFIEYGRNMYVEYFLNNPTWSTNVSYWQNAGSGDGAFDVSDYNNGTTYATLSDAIAAVPTFVRKGGMSIKYIVTDENKYVQWRYMLSSTINADFVNVNNWQGVDVILVPESQNLIESGAVYKEVNHINDEIGFPYTKEYTDADKDDRYWNGSAVATGHPTIGSIIVQLYEGAKYDWQNCLNVTTFGQIPQVGDANPVRIVNSVSGSLTAEHGENYAMFTHAFNGTNNVIITVAARGICKIVEGLSESVETIEAVINEDLPIRAVFEPLHEDHGLIQNLNSIYRDGDESYIYTYGIYAVNPRFSYIIASGHSVNTQYACAKASKSTDPTDVVTLLGGNATQYTNEPIVIPAGYDRLLVNQKFENPHYWPSVIKISTEVNKAIERLNAIVEGMQNPTTKSVKETGSLLSQDEINSISSKQRKLNRTNTNTSIIAFIYDDSFSTELVTKFEARGLKVSFAMIGNIDPNNSSWKSDAEALRAAQKNGHGTVAHGVVGGITVTGSGVSTMNDQDVKLALEGENGAFDYYKLSRRGLVEFNNWADRAHTWAIVARYYDYLIGFGTPINSPGSTSLFELGRFSTDGSTMLATAKEYVDNAITQGNCLLIFGGHYPSRTGAGGEYSTMADFESLLDYVKEKVDNGLLLSMNIDDAVDKVWSRHNGILKKNFTYEDPDIGGLMIDTSEQKIKYCSNAGVRAVYDLSLSGTPIAGSFKLTIGETTKSTSVATGQTITVDVASGNSISDVIDTILSKIYNAYTVRKKDNSTIRLYRDVVGITFTPEISDNTSGITFAVTEIQAGVDSEWM